MADPRCPFCPPASERVFLQTPLVTGLWDAFPASPGHALLITKRHAETWLDTSDEEKQALVASVEMARQEILRRHSPDGFNVGWNIGAAAGQTVFHVHVHVIPRYEGDVEDPRGGVRLAIPLSDEPVVEASLAPEPRVTADLPHGRALVTGRSDAFLPHLRAHIDRAVSFDIAVAFIRRSGLELIEEHLRDLLDRGGRLRIVAGDYLDVTEPEALRRFLDLEGAVAARVYQTAGTPRSFHPKAYIARLAEGFGVAYVGSSNLTATALDHGLEWNARLITSRDRSAFEDIQGAFEELFADSRTRALDHDWIDTYEARRRPPAGPVIEVDDERLPPPPEPHAIQVDALRALERTRAEGHRAGLVVMATGLGKTWLSAFDSNRPEVRRLLFVAHREEILTQAIKTFRRIRPRARIGRYTGPEKAPEADLLFASIQTLGRSEHLRRFDPAAFDTIVIDEFHHAAARTYRQLIDHFEPGFLLGLTATPERTDGGDLLALCQQNLVYRCDVFDGIRRQQLCPFRYFGVPDAVDYENIPWRSARFDEAALTSAVATRARAANALEQLRRRGGTRTLAFCCSQLHADFMADYFREEGLRAAAVHSGERSDPRAASLEALERGELDVLCAVDMFNEGVDLPQVDTVLMLRPTESNILWAQQFGRGLRRAEGKDHLRVIDYIGNHRIFLTKPRALLGLGPGDGEVAKALEALAADTLELPPGCEITYELEAIELLRSILRRPAAPEALEAYYRDFRERHGQRPSALETMQDGFNPRSLRPSFGSWHRFVRSMGDLEGDQGRVVDRHDAVLDRLATLPSESGLELAVLLALLNCDALPGRISVDELEIALDRIARRSAALSRVSNRPSRLRSEVLPALSDWVSLGGSEVESTFTAAPEHRDAFQELARELIDWRLAEFLARTPAPRPEAGFIGKVSHANRKPMVFLPDRQSQPEIPRGWHRIFVNGREYEANFVKVALNVVRRADSDSAQNVLPSLLRSMFGPDAGLPGTNFQVLFERGEAGLEMKSTGVHAGRARLEPWRQYSREEIPPLFDLEFNPPVWQQGFVSKGGALFLLVTLDKSKQREEFQYQDRFSSAEEFQWQSQNRTRQASKHGKAIKNHAAEKTPVHLFVRNKGKERGRACPFVYCGEVDFVRWDGEKPITVWWRLREAVPSHMRALLKVPGES